MAKPKKPAKKIKAAAKSKIPPGRKAGREKDKQGEHKTAAPQPEAARSLSDVMKSSALRRLMVR